MSSVLGGETVREAAERARWRVTQRRRAEVDAAAAAAAAEEAAREPPVPPAALEARAVVVARSRTRQARPSLAARSRAAPEQQPHADASSMRRIQQRKPRIAGSLGPRGARGPPLRLSVPAAALVLEAAQLDSSVRRGEADDDELPDAQESAVAEDARRAKREELRLLRGAEGGVVAASRGRAALAKAVCESRALGAAKRRAAETRRRTDALAALSRAALREARVGAALDKAAMDAAEAAAFFSSQPLPPIPEERLLAAREPSAEEQEAAALAVARAAVEARLEVAAAAERAARAKSVAEGSRGAPVAPMDAFGREAAGSAMDARFEEALEGQRAQRRAWERRAAPAPRAAPLRRPRPQPLSRRDAAALAAMEAIAERSRQAQKRADGGESSPHSDDDDGGGLVRRGPIPVRQLRPRGAGGAYRPPGDTRPPFQRFSSRSGGAAGEPRQLPAAAAPRAPPSALRASALRPQPRSSVFRDAHGEAESPVPYESDELDAADEARAASLAELARLEARFLRTDPGPSRGRGGPKARPSRRRRTLGPGALSEREKLIAAAAAAGAAAASSAAVAAAAAATAAAAGTGIAPAGADAADGDGASIPFSEAEPARGGARGPRRRGGIAASMPGAGAPLHTRLSAAFNAASAASSLSWSDLGGSAWPTPRDDDVDDGAVPAFPRRPGPLSDAELAALLDSGLLSSSSSSGDDDDGAAPARAKRAAKRAASAAAAAAAAGAPPGSSTSSDASAAAALAAMRAAAASLAAAAAGAAARGREAYPLPRGGGEGEASGPGAGTGSLAGLDALLGRLSAQVTSLDSRLRAASSATSAEDDGGLAAAMPAGSSDEEGADVEGHLARIHASLQRMAPGQEAPPTPGVVLRGVPPLPPRTAERRRAGGPGAGADLYAAFAPSPMAARASPASAAALRDAVAASVAAALRPRGGSGRLPPLPASSDSDATPASSTTSDDVAPPSPPSSGTGDDDVAAAQQPQGAAAGAAAAAAVGEATSSSDGDGGDVAAGRSLSPLAWPGATATSSSSDDDDEDRPWGASAAALSAALDAAPAAAAPAATAAAPTRAAATRLAALAARSAARAEAARAAAAASAPAAPIMPRRAPPARAAPPRVSPRAPVPSRAAPPPPVPAAAPVALAAPATPLLAPPRFDDDDLLSGLTGMPRGARADA